MVKEWYRQALWLGVLLVLVGLSIYLGGHPEAATVYPLGIPSWIIGLLGLLAFTTYFYLHVRWIGEIVGHYREIDREELIIRFVKVLLFFLLMSSLTTVLVRAGLGWLALLLWLLLMLYPVAVILDNVGELDNLLSTVDAWRRNPSIVLEFLFTSLVLLVTAFFLEVNLGSWGYVVSVLITFGFVLPFSVTLLALSYLLKYPLTRRALQI